MRIAGLTLGSLALAGLALLPAGAQERQAPRIVGTGPTGEAVGVGRSTIRPARAAVVVEQPATTTPPAAPAEPAVPEVAGPPEPVADNASARALVRLERLEAELRAMTDRVERLEAETRQLREDNARLAASAGSIAVAADTTAPDSVPGSGTSSDATVPVMASATPGEAGGPSAPAETGVTAVAASAATPPAPATNPATTPAVAPSTARIASLPDGATPVSALRDARLSLQTRDYPAAERSLAALVSTWPDALEADEGRWLLGETRFVQQSWGPAAEAYVAYLGRAPEGRRVPEIYIRLAGVFRNVGDEAQRCRALNAFRDTFPDAGPVMQARYTEEASRGAACPA